MPKIFISYRRVDSQDFTDRLFEHLAKHFGQENVFQDVGDSGKIPLGVDFVEYLADQVRACDVVLVVIGEQWTRILQDRVNRDDDFVRIEVESALAQQKVVIPILKSATPMPASTDLPESIRKLARLNASRVRPNPDFARDCETLAEGIRLTFSRQTTGKPRSIDLMPAPFDWIEIPGGKGTLKTDEEGITLATPTQHYWMAKYPVTNAQYAKFIEAGGYNQANWWTATGWELCQKEKWTEPRFWQNVQFNHPTQPVVGVSWYESVAFCRWLSDHASEQILLPTEAQWQYAAQGSDQRNYPWGNQWDAERCNNNADQRGAGRTTSVSTYEGKGDSPFGVVAMAGNVWEWCLTNHHDQNNDININTDRRVLRGGSWGYMTTFNFRCYYRSWLNPYVGVNSLGFRLCRNE